VHRRSWVGVSSIPIHSEVVVALVRAVLPCALACVAGCDGNVDSEPQRLISLDQPQYQSEYLTGDGAYQTFGFRVIATIHNPTSTAIELTRCTEASVRPIYGLVPIAGEESAYSAASACSGAVPPFVVAPGETRVDTLFPRGPNAWAGTPRKPVGALEGTLELWVEEAGCSAGCEPLRSRPFVVRLAPR